MIELLGKTQQHLLRLLNKHKNGLTISELTELLGVSRNAVKQHLTALEGSQLIECGALERTAGRPTQNYVLTNKGREHFPRKYSWFAQVLLESIRNEKGEENFVQFLDKVGTSISSQYLPDLQKLKGKKRLIEAASILSELGYEAEIVASQDKSEISKLEVSNCVFYHLANTCPEICDFDLSLLTSLTGKKVVQESCIASGGNLCCFGIKK